jgi:pyrimidine operon attenuation protein/uracil phosphoribosyltransferase
MTSKIKKLIMDKAALKRCIAQLARQIIRRNRGVKNLVIIGMQTRGVVIAKAIASKIKKFEKREVPVGILDVTLYRDDFRVAFKRPVVKVTNIPFSIEKKDIILVDDVFYTGRTVRAALHELIDFGRPKSIQLAVLVDRGHQELPIRADYVGKFIKTSKNEEIAVKVEEIDKKDAVYLMQISFKKKK